MTVNTAYGEASLTFGLDTLKSTTGPSTIVATALPWVGLIVAPPVGSLSVTVKFSVPSYNPSCSVWTVMVFSLWPAAKVSVPAPAV